MWKASERLTKKEEEVRDNRKMSCDMDNREYCSILNRVGHRPAHLHPPLFQVEPTLTMLVRNVGNGSGLLGLSWPFSRMEDYREPVPLQQIVVQELNLQPQ